MKTLLQLVAVGILAKLVHELRRSAGLSPAAAGGTLDAAALAAKQARANRTQSQ